MRVLIVEDEQTLRESIVEQLQQHGFTVDATADTEDQRTVRLAALCVLELLAGLAGR